jgi:ubiquitin-protein ligase
LLIIPYSVEHEGKIGEFCAHINQTLNTGGIQKTETARKELESKNVITIHNKRLMKEYKIIANKNPDELGFRIVLADEDKLDKWIIYITNPENPKLQSQMTKLGIPAIELEITFKENYPIAPPFIRVVYPHFKFHSGHVTVGGSFCMEMLTNQGWSATFSIENVITQIKSALVDGNGEIDEVKYKQRYSMDEAQDAFKRVLATHKWV